MGMPTKENTNVALIKDPEEIARIHPQESSVYGLLRKIPVLNWFLSESACSTNSQCSGSPGDYLHKFVGVVEIFRQWPSAGVIWAKDIVNKKGGEDGIAEITKALVDDQMNYQKTKNFQTDEKKAIVEFLLSSGKYIS